MSQWYQTMILVYYGQDLTLPNNNNLGMFCNKILNWNQHDIFNSTFSWNRYNCIISCMKRKLLYQDNLRQLWVFKNIKVYSTNSNCSKKQNRVRCGQGCWEVTKVSTVGRALACKAKAPGFNSRPRSYSFHLKILSIQFFSLILWKCRRWSRFFFF